MTVGKWLASCDTYLYIYITVGLRVAFIVCLVVFGDDLPTPQLSMASCVYCEYEEFEAFRHILALDSEAPA